jgi:exopolysaccharide biosynthesis polyprenyl glycosylphosphotransferase
MNTYRGGIVFMGDILCFIGGFLLSILIAFGAPEFSSAASAHAIPLAILTALWITIFFIFNFYDLRATKPNLIFLRNFSIAGAIMLALGFAYFYLFPITRINPKTNLVIFEIISLTLILGWRRIFYLATINSFHTRFAVVCKDERHETLINEIRGNPQLGLLCIGLYQTLREFKQSGKHPDLLIIHKTAIEESELLEEMLGSHIDVMDLAEAYERILYKIPVNFINSHWVIHSIKKTRDQIYVIISRLLAIVFAISVLAVFSPLLLIIICAIKIEDRGPILIRQERSGKNGKVFKLYKFRSMIVLDADGQAETGTAKWAEENDPRITKVGRITRKLHLDELGQMINLLKGDIALVGPRPERPEFVEKLEKEIPYYFMRHTISPGFTGWAQIKFRYARTVMDSEEKFEYDLYYIKNRNIFLDAGIIMKTVQIIFTH